MKFMTAGESHGKGLVGILEGIPSNLFVDIDKINHELFRRMQGFGRGKRMAIESDKIDIYAGIRAGKTMGSPIAFIIENKDYKNWENIIGARAANVEQKTLTALRPGHADYAGCIKYKQTDARNILERASARETAAKVAIGAICKQYLEKLGIFIGSHVVQIGDSKSSFSTQNAKELIEKSDLSPVRCMDKNAEKGMIQFIENAIKNQDTAGGKIELVASGMPVGIGSHIAPDKKLDYILSSHLAAIGAVKSVSIGAGEQYAADFGSNMHDKMYLDKDKKVYRKTNNAGGIEGGISNGESIIVSLTVKPIPTVSGGLDTIDIVTKTQTVSASERSDFCAVGAAGVVAESVLAFCLADAISDTLGGDHMDEVIERMDKKRRAEL